MLPEGFLERMEKMLGAEFPAFLETYERERVVALRLNPLKKGAMELLQPSFSAPAGEAFCLDGMVLTPLPWSETGYYYKEEDHPGKHPYHEAGVYYMQEPSAQAVAGLLQVCPGMRVLDLCAAPGGKSTQLAGIMAGGGILICNEIHPARAKILSENIERMGVKNALVLNETPAHLAEIFEGYFDRILVDAPCSGEGMFRKNEEAQTEWSEENVALCAKRQDEILDCAAMMLAEGGRMVYSTCTFAIEEDEGSVERFLERRKDFALAKEGTQRLWPHKVKGEGHFMAVLEKKGLEEAASRPRALARTGLEKGMDKRQLKDCLTFLEEYLPESGMEKGNFACFGEQVYLLPKECPGLKGLKVLRPGLHLGTMKKNRFEPAHALALALSPKEVKQAYQIVGRTGDVTDSRYHAGECENYQFVGRAGDVAAQSGPRALQDAKQVFCETSADEARRLAQSYLNGMTFSVDPACKGWFLICIDGMSLGWGKAAGGIMKNHYPKGLRKG